jgi:hypothetical protein
MDVFPRMITYDLIITFQDKVRNRIEADAGCPCRSFSGLIAANARGHPVLCIEIIIAQEEDGIRSRKLPRLPQRRPEMVTAFEIPAEYAGGCAVAYLSRIADVLKGKGAFEIQFRNRVFEVT